jgi:predicted ABC-type ATPase
MTTPKQVWILAGGNGAGKSTFYRLFLASKGIQFVNSDNIARDIAPENPELAGYKAAEWAGRLRDDLLGREESFCLETVFSHESKIDFVARAKALGYEIVLVYIHLNIPELNEARVIQRVSEGGHNVPRNKIYDRIPRTMKNITAVLPLADEVWILDNSLRSNPFQPVATIKHGRLTKIINPLPLWVEEILGISQANL